MHTNYNSTNVLRTIEDILGVNYLGLNDANALPMSDVFSKEPNLQPYVAPIPGILCQPPVDPTLVPECKNPAAGRSLPQSSRFTTVRGGRKRRKDSTSTILTWSIPIYSIGFFGRGLWETTNPTLELRFSTLRSSRRRESRRFGIAINPRRC